MASRGNNGKSLWTLVVAVLFVTAMPLLRTAGDVVAQEPAPALPALRIVVLVDESGSINESDLAKEKEAARSIAAGVLAPGSVVSVVGFGSAEKPGQSAVDVVCQPTTLDSAQKRDSLARCVGDLRKRTDADGDGTDHVAALQQAYEYVTTSGPDKKIVFLLTDGKLDVSQSPSWGDTAERRNSAASAAVGTVLGQLDKAGAQVWPLGFGSVDIAALRGFAKGKSCTPAARDPQERVVPNSAELRAAVETAFSAASCAKYGTPDTGTVPNGGSVDLHVDIPVVASDASIVVYKRDQRVQVEYRAPGAGKPAPALGGSHFDFAGQSTETESLRITDPEPGRWTIRLSSAGVPAQEVAATVAYQAAVKAYLTASPPQPAAGQTVDVNMQVWARGRAVTDPQTLQGLTFTTTLGGTGFPPQQVTLADADRDGTYTGQFQVPPNASGDLTYTGQVSGIGVGGDTRVLPAKVLKAASALQAQILFDTNRAAVTPGGEVPGRVAIANSSGRPSRLRLQIADVTAGTTLTVDPATVQADPGNSEVPFTLRFGQDTALGASGGKLRLVDDADPSVIVAERLLATEVAPEPGIIEKFFWLWIGLAVVVAAALVWLWLRLRVRRKAVRVGGLTVQLLQSGQVKSEIGPRSSTGKVFSFAVHEDFTGPQLQLPGVGEVDVYRVRRTAIGLTLTPPKLEPRPLNAGEQYVIGGDRAIVIHDSRRTASGVPTGPPTDMFNTSTMDPFGGSTGAPADPFGSPSSSPPSEPSPRQPATPTPSDTVPHYDRNNPFA